MIVGVEIFPLRRIQDERGMVMHMLKATDPAKDTYVPKGAHTEMSPESFSLSRTGLSSSHCHTVRTRRPIARSFPAARLSRAPFERRFSSIAMARRIWRKASGATAAITSFPAELTERLNRLDQSVDSIAEAIRKVSLLSQGDLREMGQRNRAKALQLFSFESFLASYVKLLEPAATHR